MQSSSDAAFLVANAGFAFYAPVLPSLLVIPAEAGIQLFWQIEGELDPGFRRDDELKGDDRASPHDV